MGYKEESKMDTGYFYAPYLDLPRPKRPSRWSRFVNWIKGVFKKTEYQSYNVWVVRNTLTGVSETYDEYNQALTRAEVWALAHQAEEITLDQVMREMFGENYDNWDAPSYPRRKEEGKLWRMQDGNEISLYLGVHWRPIDVA